MDDGTVRLEATPEIPAEVRDRLRQYLNTRSASLADVAPDGQSLLVLTRFGETRQLHHVASMMGARTQLTFGDEPVGGASFYPNDPDAVLVKADVGGNEQHQLSRLDLKTGRTTRLTDGKSRNQTPVWSRAGDRLAWASTARNGKDFDIWVGDGVHPESAKLVHEVSGLWYPLDWAPGDKRLLIGHYVSINESELFVLDLEGGALTRLSPEAPKASYQSAAFGRGGATVYATSDRDGEFVVLYEVDVASGAWKPLTQHIPWDVSEVAVSPDGRTVALVTNEDGFSQLRLLDARSRKLRIVEGIPRGVISGLTFARRDDVLAFTAGTPTSTGDAYTLKLRGNKLGRWTASEMGGLDAAGLVEPSLVRFPTFDDHDIPAIYYRPKGEGPFPVLVNIHGGPESQARPFFSALTQYLVSERGIAVLYPNVRGSNGYGKSYLLLDNGRKREDSVKDIGALLDWIAAQPELDAGRVGVMGGSYGGYMVLASLVHYADRLKAGLDVVGISSFVTFLENTSAYRQDLRRAEYGDERDPEMRAFLQDISPLNRVDAVKSALFVAQGANDPRVPEGEGRQIVDAVRATGADVWYMLARNEGHGFAKKVNRDTLYLLAALFFEKHLLGP
ncbi:MAG: S9 family peptidase [Deltaproteobacteria bacterium]|nr:MAG: S9 family peptidase [Deltaproteobacteria bacterium]